MKTPEESALDALDRIIQRAYDKLSDHGKAVRDERQSNADSARRFYAGKVIGLKRPRVKKAIK